MAVFSPSSTGIRPSTAAPPATRGQDPGAAPWWTAGTGLLEVTGDSVDQLAQKVYQVSPPQKLLKLPNHQILENQITCHQ